jgi:maleamate amidohydrolase
MGLHQQSSGEQGAGQRAANLRPRQGSGRHVVGRSSWVFQRHAGRASPAASENREIIVIGEDPASRSEEVSATESLRETLDALRHDLRAKGIGHEVGLGSRPALLVVDMQRGFTEPESPLGASAPRAVEAVATLLEVARRCAVPVVYTVCLAAPATAVWQSKLPANAVLTPDSKWVDVDPRLVPAEGEPVIRKHCASAFFGSDLHERLTAAGIDSLIVTGMTTSGCVRASVVDACSLGYRVLVPAEAVADRIEASHVVSLFDMDLKYADVVSVAALSARLSTLAVSDRDGSRASAEL